MYTKSICRAGKLSARRAAAARQQQLAWLLRQQKHYTTNPSAHTILFLISDSKKGQNLLPFFALYGIKHTNIGTYRLIFFWKSYNMPAPR